MSTVYQPTRIREREWNNPNTLRSHSTTPMTTTAFKMDLMLPAMGMKRFTSHSRTPTTIRVSRICRRGMLFTFLSLLQDTSTLAQEFPCNLLAENAMHCCVNEDHGLGWIWRISRVSLRSES